MAFPSVVDYDYTLISSNATSHPQNLPVTYSAGDLLLCLFTCDGYNVGVSITTGTGWTISSNYTSTANTICLAYKLSAADSTDDDLTLATDAAQYSASFVYAISGHNSASAPDYYFGYGDSTNADPPSCTPSKGTKDYLWIVFAGMDSTVVASAAPTDFGNLLTNASGNAAHGVSISTARRTYNTGSAYDPGAFTSATEQWAAGTIAVAPPAELGLGISGFATYEFQV